MARLVDLLRAQGLTPRQAREVLRTGKVRVQGLPVGDGGREVRAADVRLDPRAPRLRVGRDLAVLHRDDRLVVAFKPAALPTAGRGRGPDLKAQARVLGAPLLVLAPPSHLDGLALLARDRDAFNALRAAVERGDVALGWCALVRGAVVGPLDLDTRPPVRVRPEDHLPGATLVRFDTTGPRLGAVPAALAAAGHPPLPAGSRRVPALCADRIALVHPFSGRRVRVRIPLPDRLDRLVRERRHG